MKLILFILGCFFAGGCQVQTTIKDKDYTGMDSIFSVSGIKSLFMDDRDYPTSGHIRYYADGGKSFLVQGNESQKMIRVYDYASGKIIHTVDVDMRDGEFFAHNARSNEGNAVHGSGYITQCIQFLICWC